MSKKLFIPGPVNVRAEVLKELSRDMIGHRTAEATELQKQISEKIQTMLNTKNTIVISTSSGSGLMEASIRSCTRKRAAVFSVGAFGLRWYEMAVANNVPADLFESEPGEPTTVEMVKAALDTGKYDVVTVTHNETSSGILNPCEEIGELISKYEGVLFLVDAVSSMGGSKIDVDKAKMDICITSTQKCIGLPPGLAFTPVSKRAYEAAKEVKYKGVYFDLVKLYDFVEKRYQYPSTPNLSHMYALNAQLDYMLNEEGLEKRYLRHQEMMNLVHDFANKYFSLFAKEGYRSHTVTCINNTRNFDVGALNKKLAEHNCMISNGYGPFKDKTFRIAHMADMQKEDILELLKILEEILDLKEA